MSSFDKFCAVEKLKSLGWKEDEDNKYYLYPPKDFIDKLFQKSFFVYDCIDMYETVYVEAFNTEIRNGN